MSVDLSLLMPEFVTRLQEFVTEANYQGLNCDVFCGFRSVEDQNKLYAQGRTVSGNIVTNARGGYSWHNWGTAADVVFKDAQGNWTWNVPAEQWKQLSDIAETQNLSWGGSWTGNAAALGDIDHFEYTNGLTIEEAVQLNDINLVWNKIRSLE